MYVGRTGTARQNRNGIGITGKGKVAAGAEQFQPGCGEILGLGHCASGGKGQIAAGGQPGAVDTTDIKA